MKKRIGILVAAALLVVSVLYVMAPRPGEATVVTLPNGNTLRLVGISTGTNHNPHTPLERLLKRLPTEITDPMAPTLGPRFHASPFQTGEDALVTWIEQTGSPNSPRVSGSIALRPEGGPIAGQASWKQFRLSNGASNQLHTITSPVWPRRAEWIECVVINEEFTDNRKVMGSFRIRNRTPSTAAPWTPASLPAVQHTGDLAVTLEEFVSGVSFNSTSRSNPDGTTDKIFVPVSGGDNPAAYAQVRFQSPRGTNETWNLFNVDLRDATGNHLEASSRSGMNESLFFRPILWPNEEAWKLRLHIKRSAGFHPDESIIVSSVPLPEPGEKHALGITNRVNGVSFWISEIDRARPRNDTSSRNVSKLRVDHDYLGKTNLFDLIHLTAQPSGKTLRISGSSWTDRYHEYNLQSIPDEATHLNLEFAVQQARFAEFTIAPNWATNEYAIRKPRR